MTDESSGHEVMQFTREQLIQAAVEQGIPRDQAEAMFPERTKPPQPPSTELPAAKTKPAVTPKSEPVPIGKVSEESHPVITNLDIEEVRRRVAEQRAAQQNLPPKK